MNKKSNSGFTLLEILVVITLILIIAGIALPRFSGVGDEGKKAKAKAELRTLQTAMESYLLNTTATAPIDAPGVETALEGATPRLVGEVSDFIDPFGDTGTSRYKYFRSSNTKYYVMFSEGPDLAATITGVSNTGDITPTNPGDDIFVTNGQLAT